MQSKLRVDTSKITGKGTFATRNIKKGEFIAFIEGSVKHLSIINQTDSNSNPNWIGITKTSWIDPQPPFRYINHSCSPNAGIRGTKSVYALKNIFEGEEVTMDYSITEVDEMWVLPNCRCGSLKCRKNIGSVTTLPVSIFKSYLPYIPTYMKEFYLRKKGVTVKKTF